MTPFLRRLLANYFIFLPLFLALYLAVSCKDPISNDDQLRFSYLFENKEGKDTYIIDTKLTITFDTVFTSIGSVTRHFLVHNTSNKELTIKSIYLAGGNQSFYSINVNGVPGSSFKDVMIAPKDSIFVFVKVNINPQNLNNPFLVTDSIVFLTGSREQNVKLLAYGQDARYIIADQGSENLRFKVIAGAHETVRWTKERPYVVYGWAAIDSLGTLEIEPGTRVYFHSQSGLWAYRYSTLNVNGTTAEPVLFRGDRLERWFDNDYAQWQKIWINEGVHAKINNAIISNAFIGVQVDPLPDNSGIIIDQNSLVEIENTIIKNTQMNGVLSRYLNLKMTNCLITNNEGCGLQLEGGEYTMKYLTIANYALTRQAPTCHVSNKVSDPAYSKMPPIDTKANFQNCIIYGNYISKEKIEFEISFYKDKNAELDLMFQNCLVKVKANETASYFKDCLRNVDPKFIDINRNKLDFRLLPESPAIGKGLPDIAVPFDILGNQRGNNPDLGAYQSGY
jgi:hypothetical protein